VLALITPYAAFVLGEVLHVSPVTAVIIAGLVIGARRDRITTAQTRLQLHSVYQTVTFLLESVVASSASPDPNRPKNTYVARTRSSRTWPLSPSCSPVMPGNGQTRGGPAQLTSSAGAAALIDQLRADGTVLTYDPASRTLRAGGDDAPPVTIGTAAAEAYSRQHRERRTA
jgi:hypothetical protein